MAVLSSNQIRTAMNDLLSSIIAAEGSDDKVSRIAIPGNNKSGPLLRDFVMRNLSRNNNFRNIVFTTANDGTFDLVRDTTANVLRFRIDYTTDPDDNDPSGAETIGALLLRAPDESSARSVFAIRVPNGTITGVTQL